MDSGIVKGLAYSRAMRICVKLKDRRWEIDERYRKNLLADIEELGEDLVLWIRQNFYASMKSKFWVPRNDALRFIGAVAEIGADHLLKSNILDDACIQDIIRLAEGGSEEKEQKLESPAACALLGIEIGRKEGKLIPTILKVLGSFHHKTLLNNIAKVPYDEKIVDVLITILPDDFLHFRQENMKTIVEYGTSYWASCALLEIGDERGIEEMVRSVMQHCSRYMGMNYPLLVENRIFSKCSAFLIEAGTPVVKHLIQALSSSDREVCRLAVFCLGGIGDHSAFEALAKFINSDMIGAIFNTANAFGELGDSRAIPLLLPLLSSKTPGASRAVESALNKLRPAWQANEFIDVLNDENERVVIFAIKALIEIKDKSAVEPLTALLESDNKKIKKATTKALKRFKKL